MPVCLQVAAFHGAHIFGFNDKVPPVIYKRVRYEWMDRACGGVKVSSESKERFPNYKFKQRRLLGMDTVRGGGCVWWSRLELTCTGVSRNRKQPRWHHRLRHQRNGDC